jgi:hypothetical protein
LSLQSLFLFIINEIYILTHMRTPFIADTNTASIVKVVLVRVMREQRYSSTHS